MRVDLLYFSLYVFLDIIEESFFLYIFFVIHDLRIFFCYHVEKKGQGSFKESLGKSKLKKPASSHHNRESQGHRGILGHFQISDGFELSLL